jgi:hypothetical protein
MAKQAQRWRDFHLVADKMRKGATHITCQGCDQRIELWDDLEREYGSDELCTAVQEQERRAQAVIDRETRTQTIIADIIATAGRANQPARQVDHPRLGVEITFVDDHGNHTDRHAFVHVDPDPLPDPEVIGVDPAWAEREPAPRTQDGSATPTPGPATPPHTTTAPSQPAPDPPNTRLKDRVWAWVIAASVVASLIGLGLAMAALL